MGNTFSRFSNKYRNQISQLEELDNSPLILERIHQNHITTSAIPDEAHVYYPLPKIGHPEE